MLTMKIIRDAFEVCCFEDLQLIITYDFEDLWIFIIDDFEDLSLTDVLNSDTILRKS